MSNRNHNLPIPFSFQFNVTSSGTPEQLQIKIEASTIAFVDGDPDLDTITDSGNGFIRAGFQVGDEITVSGSASNDGIYVITAITAGTITLRHALSGDGVEDTLTNEGAGSSVKIVTSKSIPDGIAVTVKAKYSNSGTIHLGRSSDTTLNTGNSSFSLRNRESIDLQLNNIDNLWIDSTSDGEGVEVIFPDYNSNS